MVSTRVVISKDSQRAAVPRVALISDFVEEQWPSMELVAGMLYNRLQSDQSSHFSVTRVCPAMRKRFGRLPFCKSTCHNLDRVTNRFVDYPRWLRNRVDAFELFHVIDHSYAQLVHDLPPARTVVTCHDLDTFRCLLNPQQEQRPRWFRAMTGRILSGFKKAAHIIAVSSATRDEIIGHDLFPPHRVTVISNGVHPSCSPLTDLAADARLSQLLPVEAGSAIWILNVGSTMQRKRLDVLLQVLAAVRRQLPQVHLLRVGGPLTAAQRRLARDLGVEKTIVELPSLSRDVLAAAYRRAALLLHTSEAEGFGLPLIEAMACGCPVIASDLPVLREVGASAVAYCPVADVEAWRDVVLHWLGERMRQSNAWILRRDQAIARSACFSWSEAARSTTDVYERVLNQSEGI
jgi:glycosyltransferase involved in cell wall biosynthesis